MPSLWPARWSREGLSVQRQDRSNPASCALCGSLMRGSVGLKVMLSDTLLGGEICLQRTYTHLYKPCLWKGPALAYHAILSRKLSLDDELAWQLFRNYQERPPNVSDEQVQNVLSNEAIPQCSRFPAKKSFFRHCVPTSG